MPICSRCQHGGPLVFSRVVVVVAVLLLIYLILVLTLRHSAAEAAAATAALIWRRTHVPRLPDMDSTTTAQMQLLDCRLLLLLLLQLSDLFELDKTFVKLRKRMSSTNLLASR